MVYMEQSDTLQKRIPYTKDPIGELSQCEDVVKNENKRHSHGRNTDPRGGQTPQEVGIILHRG